MSILTYIFSHIFEDDNFYIGIYIKPISILFNYLIKIK